MLLSDLQQIKSLLKSLNSTRYNIPEIITNKEKITQKFKWSRTKKNEGAFLIVNDENKAFWFLLIEWKPGKFYIVIYPKVGNTPVLEIHELINETEDIEKHFIWKYKPSKQDGYNPQRKDVFKKYLISATVTIQFPKTELELVTFLDEIFHLINVKTLSNILEEPLPLKGVNNLD